MNHRFLLRSELVSLIGVFTPDIEQKGKEFIEKCFDDLLERNPMWYNPDKTDLNPQTRTTPNFGFGFCIDCGELYRVTFNEDNVFVTFGGKEYGPYHSSAAQGTLNLLEEGSI
mgnify:CR=1 FL=1